MSLLLLALVACDRNGMEEWDYHYDAPELVLELPPAVDPKELALAGEEVELLVLLDGDEGGCDTRITLTGRDGQTRAFTALFDDYQPDATLRQRWDGLDDDGYAFDPGEVHVLAQTECEHTAGWAEGTFWVVRLGIQAMDMVELHGAPEQVPLAWHKLDSWQQGLTLVDLAPEYQVIDERSAIDHEDGSPRSPVAPHTDPDAPPWAPGEASTSTHNSPAAYVAGSTLGLVVHPGTRAISQRTGLVVDAIPEGAPELRLYATEATSEPQPFAPDQEAVHEVPLPDTLGRNELDLRWHWQALTGEGWVEVPGTQLTTHVVYTTAGQPQLRDGTELGFAPNVAWVGVLDQTSADLAGLEPDASLVLDALRDSIYEDPWVIYNPGDSAYSGYSGSYIYWDYAWSDLSDWLDRVEGVDLYCHSVSCLLSVLANHWGVYASQQVLGVGFTTNLTRAAGRESWQAWYFNSHSVVSPDDGLTLWDASVDLDGDDQPHAQPVVPLSPMGMATEDYLRQLTYDEISIVNQGQCYFR